MKADETTLCYCSVTNFFWLQDPLVLPSYEEALREGLGTSRLVIHKIVEEQKNQPISCLDSSLVKASASSSDTRGGGPIRSGLASLHQRMKMAWSSLSI